VEALKVPWQGKIQEEEQQQQHMQKLKLAKH
jgi:hypothetical protein